MTRPRLVREVTEVGVVMYLVGVWIETDGSTPGEYSWYEACLDIWCVMGWDGEVLSAKEIATYPSIRTVSKTYPDRGWLARGCSFNGDRRGPWVISEGPYAMMDEAVDAAMAEYED